MDKVLIWGIGSYYDKYIANWVNKKEVEVLAFVTSDSVVCSILDGKPIIKPQDIRDYQYDYIIIDTPPALNLLTANAYAVSDFLIIPMVADILSLVGLSQLWETVESVRSLFNSELKVLGILLTRYNRRTLLSRDVDELAAQLADQMGTVVFKSKIRPGVAIAEAPAHGESIFTYNPRSGAVQDYLEFIDEIAETIHLKGGTEHGEENE